jgi:hypothetical protein
MGVPGVAPAMPAVSSVLSGMLAMQQAKAERAQAERNAFFGETRARQTAAGTGDQLNSEMAPFRATFAANRQGLNGGTMPAIREMSRTMGRDARVGVAHEPWQRKEPTCSRESSALGLRSSVRTSTGTGPPRGTRTSGRATDGDRLPRNSEAAALEATQPPQKEARP